MNDFKELTDNLISAHKCIFLFFVLFISSVTAQQKNRAVEPNEQIDLSIPFKACFQKPDKNISAFSFASDNSEAIFIPYQTGKIAKINLSSEPLIWVSDLGGEISSDLIFDNGSVYLITKVFEENVKKDIDSGKRFTNYTLWSLDAVTGLTEWQLGFTSNTSVSLNINQDKILLITKSGIVETIKKTNGAEKVSNFQLPGIVSTSPDFFSNKFFIGTEDNSILIVSTDKAEVLSKISTVQSPASTLVVTANKLFWGEKKGFVSHYDTNINSLIWTVRFGGEISSLTLVANGILVTSLDNFVYFTSLQKGKKVWRKRLAGRILTKPLIVGNFAVLFTAVDNNAIVLDLRNGKIVNQISLADIGFILSRPVLLQKSLVFSTNKGIFSFIPTNTNCFQN
jgi:hypothetical protein